MGRKEKPGAPERGDSGDKAVDSYGFGVHWDFDDDYGASVWKRVLKDRNDIVILRLIFQRRKTNVTQNG